VSFRDISELRRAFQQGVDLKYLAFFGKQDWLSQHYTEAPFAYQGRTFLTAEHYMMYRKALLFGDARMALAILEAKTAPEAKRLGKLVSNFDTVLWDSYKSAIVTDGNLLKFSGNLELRAKLLSTGSAILVEANPKDFVWGVGLPKNDIRLEDPYAWKGKNLLGFALMEVRRRLHPRSEMESLLNTRG